LGAGSGATLNAYATPQQVVGLTSGIKVRSSVAAFYPGRAGGCVIMQSDEVKCWGFNENGNLGLGHRNKVYMPETVAAVGTGVTFIAVGSVSCEMPLYWCCSYNYN